jgi:hypothetical protein
MGDTATEVLGKTTGTGSGTAGVGAAGAAMAATDSTEADTKGIGATKAMGCAGSGADTDDDAIFSSIAATATATMPSSSPSANDFRGGAIRASMAARRAALACFAADKGAAVWTGASAVPSADGGICATSFG